AALSSSISALPPVVQPSPCTKRKSSERTPSTNATSPRTTAASIFCSRARTSAAARFVASAGGCCAAARPARIAARSHGMTIVPPVLGLDGDRRLRSARHHVDVVRLDDQAVDGVALLFEHDLGKLGIVARGFEALVAFLLRRVPADVDEGVLGVDAQFLVGF